MRPSRRKIHPLPAQPHPIPNIPTERLPSQGGVN